ncbi:FixH family protein [Pseudochrobactrum sp. MP213Fo]|uniref:FixH family protein n=1 Tax=Pseudochrobactrum sp. MP213Fo TaxID=3022250 RepID=UPI003BA1CB74
MLSQKTEGNANQAPSTPGRVFTGWHMLGIMIAFFGVIIVVNIIMATSAITSWSGLVVKNSYVASQEFNEKSIIGKAHAALNWQPEMSYQDGVVRYRLTDPDGNAVKAVGATAVFRRPVNEKEDQTLNMLPADDNFLTAEATLNDGNWVVEINTYAGLEEPYRQVNRVHITGGKFTLDTAETPVKGTAQ